MFAFIIVKVADNQILSAGRPGTSLYIYPCINIKTKCYETLSCDRANYISLISSQVCVVSNSDVLLKSQMM